jgi:hypothetical protein
MTTPKSTPATVTTKEAIFEILSKLSITDDANWTEDGEPALDVVRTIAKDDAITRQQINEAAPGFVRLVGEPKAGGPDGVRMQGTKAATSVLAEEVVNSDGRMSTEEMREILTRRVTDAETNLHRAQRDLSEAQQEVGRCEVRLTRAHKDKNRQFPPVTPAQAIKDHLSAQVRQARERAGLAPEAPVVLSPIDEVMGRSNRRGSGQTRPTRPVMDGRLVLSKTA